MFSGSGFKVERDEDGAYFIDRDGTHFRHILNFLRTGKVHVPESKQETEELLEELDFYQIASYERAVRAALEVACVYAHTGDANGVLYWLGTGGGRAPKWANPVASGAVKAAFSGAASGAAANLVERSGKTHSAGICKVAQPPAFAFGAAPAFGAHAVPSPPENWFQLEFSFPVCSEPFFVRASSRH